MSNIPPTGQNGAEWTNPSTGELFVYDRDRGWINKVGVSMQGGEMTGTLTGPDFRINQGLLALDSAQDIPDVDFDPIVPPAGPQKWQTLVMLNSKNPRWGSSGCGRYQGRMIMIAKTGDIAYCSDGVTWRAKGPETTKLGDGHDWYDNTYVLDADEYNESVLMVGTNDPSGRGHWARSLDGIGWTHVKPPFTATWKCCASKGKISVVPAYKSDKIVYNLDGNVANTDRWDYARATQSGSWSVCEYAAGSIDKFIVLPISGTKGQYSRTGTSWSAMNIPEANWNGAAYGRVDGVDYVVAVSSSSAGNRCMYTKDGINWTVVPGFTYATWKNITFCSETEQFIAISFPPKDAGDDNQLAVSNGQLDQGIDAWTFGPMPSRNKWWQIDYSKCHNQVITMSQDGEAQIAIWDLNRNQFSVAGEGDEEDLVWNDEKIVIADVADFAGQEYAVPARATGLFSTAAELGSSIGKAKFLQDSTPDRDSDFIRAGDLWYQPSNNRLHVRDSADGWVALFQ